MTYRLVAVVYDYIIIGAGAAGLHVALELIAQGDPGTSRTLILDPQDKTANDRTWCYWHQGEDSYDPIVFHSWDKAHFASSAMEKMLTLKPYRYKMIRSADFYAYAKNIIDQNPHIEWLHKSVTKVHSEGDILDVHTQDSEIYRARTVLDSRIDKERWKQDTRSVKLVQHFHGWVIETDGECFDPEVFTMMDFRHRPPESTAFTYVLPTSARTALVEFTYFDPQPVTRSTYETYLRRYIHEQLHISDYEVIEQETGQIPMSSHDFARASRGRHIRIGTAGGWVKASTGYAFKRSRSLSERLVSNLLEDRPWHDMLYSSKHQWYDRIFLGVLAHNNALGAHLFGQLYGKNDIKQIFSFLDQETSLGEELKIIWGFDKAPFLRSLWKNWKS